MHGQAGLVDDDFLKVGADKLYDLLSAIFFFFFSG